MKIYFSKEMIRYKIKDEQFCGLLENIKSKFDI